MSKVRVLLPDDHEGILACVRTVLDEEFEVVGAVQMPAMKTYLIVYTPVVWTLNGIRMTTPADHCGSVVGNTNINREGVLQDFAERGRRKAISTNSASHHLCDGIRYEGKD